MMSTILAGLSLGAVYALVAVGYNIVFMASGILNFAQAQFLMIGAFLSLGAARVLDLPLPVAVVGAAVIAGMIGGLEEVAAIRRLVGRGTHGELITTLGFATVLSGIALVIYGSDAQTVPYLGNLGSVTVAGGRAQWVDVILIVVAVTLTAGVGIVTRRSMLGLASLATSEDRQAAQLRGVSVAWMSFGAFVLAGALLAAVGPLVGAKTQASYSLGDELAVKAFVALVIGGFGSYPGALIGGFIVGLLELFTIRYAGFEWSNLLIFVLLLVVLIVLPRGIFGRTRERVV